MAPLISTPPINKQVITKEFLEKALEKEANGGPISEILSHTTTLGTKPGDNYMSIIYSVDVQFVDGTTRNLLVKCYPNHPSRQEFNNSLNVFFKECEIYSKWMPELRRLQTDVVGLKDEQVVKLPYPPFIHGECINFQSAEGQARKSEVFHSLDNFILMEDVQKSHGFRMISRFKPLDLDHMRLVVEALAKIHSLSWAYRNHVEPNITEKFPCFLPPLNNDYLSGGADFVNSNLNQAINDIFNAKFGSGNEYSAAAKRFRPLSLPVAKFFLGDNKRDINNNNNNMILPFDIDQEPWRIICHGDCWINNLLFRYDQETGKPVEVALVDLPMAQETCVINDLEYVIHACTDLQLRRAHTDDLLQLYHDTFNAVCKLLKTPILPGFCMDSLRFRYHRGKLFGFYTAMMCLPIMLKEQEELMDFEDMEMDKDFAKVFFELASSFGSNCILKERLIGLTQGMIEDGVF